MPKFSIIIPVYNVASYLEFCLNSVLDQVFTDYECILIDDGSTDESPKICDEYSLKDSRIKVIHKKNGGLSDARNTGILDSTGEYIVLLDSDDLLSTNESLLNLNKVITRTNSDVIFNSNFITFSDNSNTIDSFDQFIGNDEYYSPIKFYKNITRGNNRILAGCFFSAKKSFLIKNNLFFFNGIFHEDELWMPFIICYSNKIAINHNPFYSYRKNRENSIMSALNPKRLSDIQTIIDELQTNKPCVSKNVKFIIDERCILLWHTVFNSVFCLEEKYTNEKIVIIKKLKEQKRILIRGRKIKYFIYFLLLLFFDTQYIYSLRKKFIK